MILRIRRTADSMSNNGSDNTRHTPLILGGNVCRYIFYGREAVRDSPIKFQDNAGGARRQKLKRTGFRMALTSYLRVAATNFCTDIGFFDASVR